MTVGVEWNFVSFISLVTKLFKASKRGIIFRNIIDFQCLNFESCHLIVLFD